MPQITPSDETLWAFVHNEASESERHFVLSEMVKEPVRKRLHMIQQLDRLLSYCGQVSRQHTSSPEIPRLQNPPCKQAKKRRSLQFPVIPPIASRSHFALQAKQQRWLGY